MNYKQAAKGAIGNFLQTGGEKLINLALFSYLARVLPIEIFGFTAAFMVFVEIGIMVSGAGLASGLISCKRSTVLITDTAFTIVTAVSIILFLPVYIFSDQISLFLGFENKGFYLVMVFSILLIQSFGAVPKALLMRSFSFNTISKICFFGSVIGAFSAIIACSSDQSFYALWFFYFMQSLVSSFLFFVFAKYFPGFYFSGETFNALRKVSFPASLSSVLSMVTDKIIPLSIAKFLGPEELGLYSIVLRPCTVVWQLLVSSMQKVFLPLFSISNSSFKDARKLARLFYPLIVFVFPTCFFIILFSAPIMTSLFGNQFKTNSSLLSLAAANLIIFSFCFMNDSLLLTSNNPSKVCVLGLLRLFLILGLVFFTIKYSLTALLVGLLFVNLFFFLFSLFYLRFSTGIDLISSLFFCKPLFVCMAVFACLNLLIFFLFTLAGFSLFFLLLAFFITYLFFVHRLLNIPLISPFKTYVEAFKAFFHT